jgi:hypothetical protein
MGTSGFHKGRFVLQCPQAALRAPPQPTRVLLVSSPVWALDQPMTCVASTLMLRVSGEEESGP